MTVDSKIATWNLCLGLSNKKDYISHVLNREKINICSQQECEVTGNIEEKYLSIKNFKLKLEENDVKKRAGFYINNQINYIRRKDLETKNFHVVIIDVDSDIS